MILRLSPVGGVAAQFFDNNGNPLSGGRLYVYAAGTTTPAVTYTTSAGTTLHTNPIVLDSGGRVPGGEIWLTDGVIYKFVLKNATEVVIATYDNIVGINANFVNYIAAQEIQTATEGQTVFDLTTMSYQPGTNSLTVYVNGVNQYGPGATFAYTETDGNTVTFTSGLFAGASVKFTTTQQTTSNSIGADSVAYLPAGTGAVATTAQDKLRNIQYSPQDVGATGLGDINDAAAIQIAHDNIVATGKFGVLTLPSGSVFKCNSGLTINVSLVRIDGNGSKFDFSSMSSGFAVTLTGKGTGTPYTQGVGGLRGIELAGAGSASSAYGIKFDTVSEAGPSHITLEGTSTHGFLVGHTFLNNAYAINIVGGDVYDCGTCISQPSGNTNYGERISYVGTNLFNSAVAVDCQNPDGEFVLTSCSVDYCGRVVYNLGGRVYFNNCHIEASDYAIEPFYLSGTTGATVVMNAGWFLCTGTNTSNIAYVGTTASKGGGAFFRDVFMNNITTAKYFATGVGNIEVSNLITYDTPSNIPTLLRQDQSLAIDGGFEQSTPQDVFITSDSSVITSRTTGTDIQLANVTTSPRTGVRSLKMTKVFGAGTAAQFAFVGRLVAGKRYSGFRLWYAKGGTQTGTLYIASTFAAVRDDVNTPQIVKTASTTGVVTVNFTSDTVPYTEVIGGFDLGKAPSWATHLVVLVNADNVNAGDLYFDDFEVYEW